MAVEILAIARPSASLLATGDQSPMHLSSADVIVTGNNDIPMHAAFYISGVDHTHSSDGSSVIGDNWR